MSKSRGDDKALSLENHNVLGLNTCACICLAHHTKMDHKEECLSCKRLVMEIDVDPTPEQEFLGNSLPIEKSNTRTWPTWLSRQKPWSKPKTKEPMKLTIDTLMLMILSNFQWSIMFSMKISFFCIFTLFDSNIIHTKTHDNFAFLLQTYQPGLIIAIRLYPLTWRWHLVNALYLGYTFLIEFPCSTIVCSPWWSHCWLSRTWRSQNVRYWNQMPQH